MDIKTGKFPIHISPLFFASVTLLFTVSENRTVLIALVSSVLHECGHLALLLFFGCKIRSVTLSFYGMKLVRENETELDFSRETAVCIAGVTVNFIIFSVFLAAYAVFGKKVFIEISAVNLVLALFNFLPVFFLDGGRVLECLLKSRFELEKSEKILNAVSVVSLLPVYAAGIFLFVKKGNFTLLLCAVYLTAASLIK